MQPWQAFSKRFGHLHSANFKKHELPELRKADPTKTEFEFWNGKMQNLYAEADEATKKEIEEYRKAMKDGAQVSKDLDDEDGGSQVQNSEFQRYALASQWMGC